MLIGRYFKFFNMQILYNPGQYRPWRSRHEMADTNSLTQRQKWGDTAEWACAFANPCADLTELGRARVY